MNFDFLTAVTLKEQPKKERVYAGKPALERNPTNGADLRLFKDGSIYPSVALVATHNLEYREKSASDQGNGFDVIDSRKWGQYPEGAQAAVFIAAVPKSAGKVDIFGSARKNSEGEITSVLDQGSKTFGEDLINMLQDVYNVELFKENKYVDLQIVTSVAVPSADGIYFVPKEVVRGPQAGTYTTERRENLTVNPLAIYVAPTTEDANTSVEDNEEASIA